MSLLEIDDVKFHFVDNGHGLPLVFQHGLGGDLNQPIGLYHPQGDVRLIAFDMRGHGETRPLGDVDKLAIATFADDLITLVDQLGIEQAVIGGISLGAAVAVNGALRYPDRVLGLVLVRPAWIDRPMPENVSRYTAIAGLIFCFDSLEEPGTAIKQVKDLGKFVGVSLLVTEPVGLLRPYWHTIDQVTIVGTPMGTKGTSMEPTIFDKIREARAEIDKYSAKVEIQVDGGIRRNTVPEIAKGRSGLDRPGLVDVWRRPGADASVAGIAID